jgi:hypothetical protein
MLSSRTTTQQAAPRSLLGLVLLVLLPLCPQGADSTVISTPPSLLDGTGLLYANRVEGATILDPRAIWSPVRVKFNCSTAAVRRRRRRHAVVALMHVHAVHTLTDMHANLIAKVVHPYCFYPALCVAVPRADCTLL